MKKIDPVYSLAVILCISNFTSLNLVFGQIWDAPQGRNAYFNGAVMEADTNALNSFLKTTVDKTSQNGICRLSIGFH